MANIEFAHAGHVPAGAIADRVLNRRSAAQRAGKALRGLASRLNRIDRAMAGYMGDLARARNLGDYDAE